MQVSFVHTEGSAAWAVALQSVVEKNMKAPKPSQDFWLSYTT